MVFNKVVAHFKDGRVVKGRTNNFLQNKPNFHIIPETGGGVEEVRMNNLKAVEIIIEELKGAFFVKDLEGDRTRKDLYEDAVPGGGRKVRVKFFDGEEIIGYTMGYSSNRPGFFIIPADRSSNNTRIFVVRSATKEVEFIQ